VDSAHTAPRLKSFWEKITGDPGAAWLDGLLLVPLLILSFSYLYASPEFAANLPQDAVDFVLPALNLVEHGSLATTCYGQHPPPAHPFGMPLLLAPAYLIFGHFPGNGIYSILFFALGAVTTVYFIGRRLGGRVCGCFAALFLVTHNGFRKYAAKIMSEVPSIFLLALILLWMLRLRGRSRTSWGYCGIGTLVGLAIAVRWDNALVLVPTFALLVHDSWKCSLKRGVYVGIGLILWLVALGFYNYAHFGSPLRTGYHYWGNAGTETVPLFSFRYATARGYWRTRGYSERFIQANNGNLLLLLKTLLNQADMTRTFNNPSRWDNIPGRYTYQALVIARTLLGFAGLAWCIRLRRKLPSADAALWFTSLSMVMILFYTFYSWQEERFLLRLVPFFCVFDAMSPAVIRAITEKWPSSNRMAAAFCGHALICGLICLLTYLSASGLVPQGDDNLHLYQAMHSTSSITESNAVVVTDWDPFRPDLYIIQGTQRTLIPLSKDARAPFAASEEPEKLIALSRQGRPIYLLLHDPASPSELGMRHRGPRIMLAIAYYNASTGGLDTLAKYFQYEPLLTYKDRNGQPLWPYLFKLHARPFSIN